MKVLILFLLAFSFTVNAELIDTEDALIFKLDSNDEAMKMFNALSLPLVTGDKVTGIMHQFKYLEDPKENFYIYCAETLEKKYDCRISINKSYSGANVELEDSDLQLHLMLVDLDFAKYFYEILNFAPIFHSNFGVKVLSDENLNFGISCIANVADASYYQCDVRLFKR